MGGFLGALGVIALVTGPMAGGLVPVHITGVARTLFSICYFMLIGLLPLAILLTYRRPDR